MMASSCRICGSTRHQTVLSNYQAMGRSWDLIQCLSCGLVSTEPIPDDDILEGRYSQDYWAASDDRTTGAVYNIRMRGFARRLRKMVRSGDKALDVGAGNGAWVGLLNACGFEAVGIDPYAAGSAAGPVLKYALEDAPFEKTSFDLISFMHVLEHTRDPAVTLKTAHQLLKPGGLLVIEVPNIGSLGFTVFNKRWFPLDDIPSHINHFNRQSLIHSVRNCGTYTLILDGGFSLKDSPSILVNSLFPGLSPRRVRRRNDGRHPLYLKVIYLMAQATLLPAAMILARAGRGEIIRLVFKKYENGTKSP